METVPVKVIVIHDDIDEKSPIMVELYVRYHNDHVLLFKHSQTGLDYVLNHLGQKMVVLLDINFYDGKELSGLKVFERIREKTSLVYIILTTVSKINDIDEDSLKMLINKELFSYESFTSDYSNVLLLIEEAIMKLNVRVDAVIEAWMMRHSPEVRSKPFIKTKIGEVYSMNDVLDSIRMQTAIGIEFEKNLLKLAIDIFSKQKIQTND